MNVILDTESKYFSKKNKLLELCYTIQTQQKTFHYEFEINQSEAIIHSDTSQYLEEVVDTFRQKHKNITKFRTKDHSFYKEFDPVYTYPLPIRVIQPSKFFLDEQKIKELESIIDLEQITIPVTILNDEYVCLGNHSLLYLLWKNDYKMAMVYIDTPLPNVYDFVYLAKENNLRSISKIPILSHEEYNQYWIRFCEDYFTTDTE